MPGQVEERLDHLYRHLPCPFETVQVEPVGGISPGVDAQ
jgi:hypothetical protein